jgi:hypothetical protein
MYFEEQKFIDKTEIIFEIPFVCNDYLQWLPRAHLTRFKFK